jgi:DedD protein
MKELGLPAYTEKLDSDQGVRTRVRAGPFATREAAEKAQAKIKKIGVAGTVAAQ